MAEHNFIGKIGEDLARAHLEKHGYKILEQNYKTKYSEIDLITEKTEGIFGKKKLIFVEVRTKIGENFGSPEDTINKAKLKRVLKNALSYSAFKKWQGPCRIDAICIILNQDFTIKSLNHYEDIIS